MNYNSKMKLVALWGSYLCLIWLFSNNLKYLDLFTWISVSDCETIKHWLWFSDVVFQCGSKWLPQKGTLESSHCEWCSFWRKAFTNEGCVQRQTVIYNKLWPCSSFRVIPWIFHTVLLLITSLSIDLEHEEVFAHRATEIDQRFI